MLSSFCWLINFNLEIIHITHKDDTHNTSGLWFFLSLYLSAAQQQLDVDALKHTTLDYLMLMLSGGFFADAVSSTTRHCVLNIKNILIKTQQTTKLQFPISLLFCCI